MAVPPTAHDAASRFRRDAERITQLADGLRRIHPERMTAHDWYDLRTDLLGMLDLLREQILLTAELLESRGGHRERGDS